MVNELFDLIKTRQREPETIRALAGDGNYVIAVANRPGYIWARVLGRDAPVQVYAPGSDNLAHNMLIKLRKVKAGHAFRYEMIGVDVEAYLVGQEPPGTSVLPLHGETHEWGSGGQDLVMVHQRQFTPLLMTGTNPTSTAVRISAGQWWNGGVLIQYFGENFDLSSYVPVTPYAKYVLLYLDQALGTIGVAEGALLPDTGIFPDPYEAQLTAPTASMPVGFVMLRSSRSTIELDCIWPARNILSPCITAGTVAEGIFMLAAKADGIYKSFGGAIWQQVDDTDPYLIEGLITVHVIDTSTWMVCRKQATAVVTDPLIYRTTDRGETWAKAQSGMGISQGTSIWRVWASWQNPLAPNQIVVVVGKATELHTPQIFMTLTGGDAWVEVSNTGLPAITPATETFPFAVSVKTTAPFFGALTLVSEGLYTKYSSGAWAQADVDDEYAYAVQNDASDAEGWIATTTSMARHTVDNWVTHYESLLAFYDSPSTETVGIFQNTFDPKNWAVGGHYGIHTTLNGSGLTQYVPMRIGPVGSVLTTITGAASYALFTDQNGGLYISKDGCVQSVSSMGISGVISVSGTFTQIAISEGGGGGGSLDSWLEVWCWG